MPIAAALPAIIGAAGSIGGGLFANKKTSSQKDLEKWQAALAQQELARQQMLMPAGQSAIDWYTSLLGGDKQKMATTLAPASQGITSAYNQARNSMMANLAPGGVRDLALAKAKQGQVADIGNLFTQAGPMAASALGNLFSSIGNNSGAVTSGYQTLANLDAFRGANLQELGGNIGTQLKDIIANWPKKQPINPYGGVGNVPYGPPAPGVGY